MIEREKKNTEINKGEGLLGQAYLDQYRWKVRTDWRRRTEYEKQREREREK